MPESTVLSGASFMGGCSPVLGLFENPAMGWTAFGLLVGIMLFIDLGLLSRRSSAMTMKSALIWSAVWISTALLFGVGVYFFKSPADSYRFLAGYFIEEALSVDNLFVFVLIFSYFKVPAPEQRTVLYWGIFGAVVMRALFIWLGIEIIKAADWILYVFGAFLIYTGVKLLFKNEDDEIDPERNIMVRLLKMVLPVTPEYHGKKFFVRIANKLHATPLFAVLLVVETTDLIFAVDSIPAVFSVAVDAKGNIDTFIVYTSNVFAILGLRSLYFALAGLMDKFHYLKYGLSAILTFVGLKMTAIHYYLHHYAEHSQLDPRIPLGVIVGILALCVLASVLFPPKHAEEHDAKPADDAAGIPKA